MDASELRETEINDTMHRLGLPPNHQLRDYVGRLLERLLPLDMIREELCLVPRASG